MRWPCPVNAIYKENSMSRGLRQQAPALIIAVLALVAALSGTVYAAAKINGKTIKVKSIPGNRLAVGSVPANRLKPGVIPATPAMAPAAAPGSITGVQIDAATLGQVPSAVFAERSQSAQDAETALNAVNAQNAKTVNGYGAGCKAGTRPFAGACWLSEPSSTALTAPAAAAACAAQNGELPDALSLAAFSQQPGVALAAGDEWTSDISVVSSEDVYAVVTATEGGKVASAVSTANKKFRCVIPLVG
jgi:hypothetical protein